MKTLTQEQIEDNARAYQTGEQEGWGYAVQDYTDGTEYKDPKTRKLWKEARDKLNELQDYLRVSYEASEEYYT